jgi:hypothetical protein
VVEPGRYIWIGTAGPTAGERTECDALSEVAVMSARGKWLGLWQPIAIRSAMLAGARPEAIMAAIDSSLQVAYERRMLSGEDHNANSNETYHEPKWSHLAAYVR